MGMGGKLKFPSSHYYVTSVEVFIYARIFGGIAASIMATAASGPWQCNFSLLSTGYKVASIILSEDLLSVA